MLTGTHTGSTKWTQLVRETMMSRKRGSEVQGRGRNRVREWEMDFTKTHYMYV